MKKYLLLITAIAALTTAVVGLKTYAVDAPKSKDGGQALEIAPPVINLSVKPGQTITTKINLRDISDGSLVVTNQINDFVAAGEDGTPKIVLKADPDNPYSLKTWIKPIPETILKPREIRKLNVTIHVPQNASPGGYYGVIRFTGTPPNLKGQGVSLSASLGSLVLIKVKGKTKEAMSIADFSVSHKGAGGPVLESTPLDFTERIQNDGNIFEKPTGLVTITDMFGKKVANLNVNLEGGNVLPRSIRKFSQPLDKSVIGNKALFGHYKAHLSISYAGGKKIVTSDIGFWVIPYKLIGLLILLLIIAFIALRIMIKRYNRHIIGKSRRSRR